MKSNDIFTTLFNDLICLGMEPFHCFGYYDNTWFKYQPGISGLKEEINPKFTSDAFMFSKLYAGVTSVGSEVVRKTGQNG